VGSRADVTGAYLAALELRRLLAILPGGLALALLLPLASHGEGIQD
jgi:hypothetical protein